VGEWVKRLCGERLDERSERVASIERSSHDPGSSKDIEALLRLRRGSAPTETPGSAAEIVPESRQRYRTYQSGLSHAEIPPTPSPDEPLSEPRPVWKSWQFMVGGAAVLLLLGLGGFYQLRGTVAGNKTTMSTQPQAFVPLPTPSPPTQPAPPPPSVSEPSPSLAPADEADENATKSVDTPAPVAAPTHRKATSSNHVAKPKRVALKVAKKPSEGKNCNPPFYIDYQGIRRVKPNCL
jgi:hypothetical protein